MAEGTSLHKIVVAILAVAATVLVLVILWNTQILRKPFLPELAGEDEPEEVTEDLQFYSEFVKNYKECKLSPSANCYCQFTNPNTPENFVIEIQNFPNSKKTIITLYGNAKLDDCKTLLALHGAENLQPVKTEIENDLLYFENVYTKPDAVLDNFAQIGDPDRLYLHKKELCSTKDVKGDIFSYDGIDFKNGIMYKFDSEKTALFSSITSLKKCETQKDVVPAYDEFNRLISVINQCSRGPCPYIVKNQELSIIPQDYTITIKNKKIFLEYKGKEIRSSELKKETCLFSHYRNTNPNEAETITTLTFNDYVEVDIYNFKNKICFLPYTYELAQEKKIEEIKTTLPNEPIVPE